MKKAMPFLILISMMLSLCSCQDKKPLLFDYLENRHQSSIADSVICVLILSDQGCANCNLVYKDFVYENKDNDKVEILLTAKGKLFDISDLKTKTILIDQNIAVTTYAELDRSQAIFVKQNKIDTTIVINANSIQEQIAYLTEKIQ